MKKNVEGRNTPMGVFTARQLREWLLVVNVMSIVHTLKTVGQVEYFEKILNQPTTVGQSCMQFCMIAKILKLGF